MVKIKYKKLKKKQDYENTFAIVNFKTVEKFKCCLKNWLVTKRKEKVSDLFSIASPDCYREFILFWERKRRKKKLRREGGTLQKFKSSRARLAWRNIARRSISSSYVTGIDARLYARSCVHHKRGKGAREGISRRISLWVSSVFVSPARCTARLDVMNARNLSMDGAPMINCA